MRFEPASPGGEAAPPPARALPRPSSRTEPAASRGCLITRKSRRSETRSAKRAASRMFGDAFSRRPDALAQPPSRAAARFRRGSSTEASSDPALEHGPRERRATKSRKNIVVQCDDFAALPEAVAVIGGRRTEILLVAQVHAKNVEDPRRKRRTAPVDSGHANRVAYRDLLRA